MLHDDDGVPGVAQLFENVDEPGGVARMKADAGFIEHEERIDEARAETRRQVHALRLAARQRARRPVEREIAKADLDEISQPRPDFAQRERERVVRQR